MTINSANFHWIRELLERNSGNTLEAEKSYLVESRLTPVAESLGLRNIDALIDSLRLRTNRETERRIVESMLTHESSFFRDPHYFDAIANQILPRLQLQRSETRQITVWCGACAAGQEPYSLAMLIKENFGPPEDWSVRIIASDLSRPMLEQAMSGSYSEIEVQRGLSAERRQRFFRQIDRRWIVRDDLRQMVEFQEFNLCAGQSLPPIADVILLRNVLIYLSESAQEHALSLVTKSLAPDGCLLIGSTETLYQHAALFTRDPDCVVPCFRPVVNQT